MLCAYLDHPIQRSMINPFQPGDTQSFIRTVRDADLARFDSGLVHAVYATFALARDAEWASRLFVLAMKEDHEEGIGVSVSVEHLAPAPQGSDVRLTSTLVLVDGNRIECRWEAHLDEVLVTRGEQVQRILPKERIAQVFAPR